LVLASHRPHKRLAPLARAWSSAASGLPLVMAGERTDALHAPPAVYGLGFVSDAAAEALLADAVCLVSASAAEGFGLPVLAAMAAGIPIVAAAHPALIEVAGDAAAWCGGADLAALVRTAAAVVGDQPESRRRIALGRARAAEFTAPRAVAALRQLIGA
jgi:glycosyltransferase involved in cell wall biosynthesis